MSIERIKGRIAYECDLKGCHEGLETDETDFAAAKETARAEGWITVKRGADWKNFCCKAHEEMDYRGQSLSK